MRVNKLREIKQLLDQVVRNNNYFIYIAPLNREHYERYIEIIKKEYKDENLDNLLTNDDILIETSQKIDVNISVLVDTNLYVGNVETNEIGYGNELLKFLENNSINYNFFFS